MADLCEKKIAFLDRDGVINVDFGYVHKSADLKFLDGVEDGLLALLKQNFKLFIVTNQAGIARGYYTENDFHEFMNFMLKALRMRGIDIDGYEFCPHHPEGIVLEYSRTCNCRKPGPGMLQRIMEREGVRPSDCIMIGDKISDIDSGKDAGVKTSFLLNKNPGCAYKADYYHVKNWRQLTALLQALPL